MARWVEPPPALLANHTNTGLSILAAAPLIQLPTNVPGKAVESGPSA